MAKANPDAIWWVRLRGGSTLFKARIVAQTQRIIRIQKIDEMFASIETYEVDYVELVEEASSPD